MKIIRGITMSAKTKIVVVKMRELVYTGIFVALGVLLILFFISMFLPKEKAGTQQEAASTQKYRAGVYTTSLTVNQQSVGLEVLVDEDHINAVRMINLSETAATMLPLFEPTLDSINEQLVETQSIEALTYPEGSKYTSQALIEAIKFALSKATP
jgi:uncharacterized protein with FMN-binding domain